MQGQLERRCEIVSFELTGQVVLLVVAPMVGDCDAELAPLGRCGGAGSQVLPAFQGQHQVADQIRLQLGLGEHRLTQQQFQLEPLLFGAAGLGNRSGRAEGHAPKVRASAACGRPA